MVNNIDELKINELMYVSSVEVLYRIVNKVNEIILNINISQETNGKSKTKEPQTRRTSSRNNKRTKKGNKKAKSKNKTSRT